MISPTEREPIISFVWTPHERLPAGTGGSENYTIGQVRELLRRGIAAQIVTVGMGLDDGRGDFVDIPFRSLPTAESVGDLVGPVVFITHFPPVVTSSVAYQMLHIPPPLREAQRRTITSGLRGRHLIATSQFAAELWSSFLAVGPIAVVYPFAEPEFAGAERPATHAGAIRILYAGRLSPEKGIYTLLSMLHNDLITDDLRLTFTATSAGGEKPQGRIIQQLVAAHPGITLVAAQNTPEGMADLMAAHDIVVMPSNAQYWHETFGIVSIEAQHAGCRVVASRDGGLPETDCGTILFVDPDDAEALATGIHEAISRGPVSAAERRTATGQFTVAQSVDQLLATLTPMPDAMPRLAVLPRPPAAEPVTAGITQAAV